ncbi:PHD finger protein 7-like isoform X1 [Meleagris gallopavo]|uniref:PHD finger protein 7-like isoform X1 n=1 Tax=Meleagris gallopavo TaxID=9103 RepID=UPI0012AB70E1|nr:PHD finger protein 7-like isoform X1 [Meleagris gallopavo]
MDCVVGNRSSYSTMVCPSCRRTWFHRTCIQVGALPLPSGEHQAPLTLTLLVFLLQRLALYAGVILHCPHCKDEDEFFDAVAAMGIRIPPRGPVWDDNLYAQKGDKSKRCNASVCCFPHGRERAGEGPWELLLCSSCAAQGTHRHCSNLRESTTTWACNTCAGEGTSSSCNVDSAGPSTAIQLGLGPFLSPTVSDSSSSCSITSQASSGPVHSSEVPESSVLPRQRTTEWRRVCSRLHRNDDASNEPQGCCGSRDAAEAAVLQP